METKTPAYKIAARVHLLCVLTIVLTGAYYISGDVGAYIEGLNSENWPTSEGTITHAELSSWTKEHRGKTLTFYKTDFAYEFIVDGQTYTGTRFQASHFLSTSKFDNEELLKKFPPNAKATIYYNPKNPTKSVMQNGASIMDLIMVGVTSITFLLGYLLFLQVRKIFPIVRDLPQRFSANRSQS
jgi:hypothetical protein